ncbi:MAG: hypothetical protein AAFQ89_18090 [Cyanobacteria bacterium J06626_18]
MPGRLNQGIAAVMGVIPSGLTLQILRLFSQQFRKGQPHEYQWAGPVLYPVGKSSRLPQGRSSVLGVPIVI